MKNSAKTATKELLEQRFGELWERCLLDGVLAPYRHPWRELTSHYNGPYRFYHTLSHITYCLQQFDQVSHKMAEPDAVEMALWFHDVIHSPSADNEAMSKALFSQLGQGCFSITYVTQVGQLIMVTTHQAPPAHQDAAFVCDIDLSSLGAPWEIFLSDSRALRMEQNHYPEEQFYRGKLSFFQSLLGRPRIFYTDYFRNKFEKIARQNILRYMQRIKQEVQLDHDSKQQ